MTGWTGLEPVIFDIPTTLKNLQMARLLVSCWSHFLRSFVFAME